MQLFKNGVGLTDAESQANRPTPNGTFINWDLEFQAIVSVTTGDTLQLENVTGACIDVNSGVTGVPSATMTIVSLN